MFPIEHGQRFISQDQKSESWASNLGATPTIPKDMEVVGEVGQLGVERTHNALDCSLEFDRL